MPTIGGASIALSLERCASCLSTSYVAHLIALEIKQIESSILSLPEEQKNSLKPVYEQFEEAYSYGVLRCVKAALQYQIES